MITKYEFIGTGSEEWSFEQTLLGKINLIVGASGSGKTRFLNTLFNFASFIVNGNPFRPGEWKMSIQTKGEEYSYNYKASSNGIGNAQKQIINYESLKKNVNNVEIILVERTPEKFIFLDQELPKIDPSRSCITLLAEEEKIKPLFRTFAHGMRRNFYDDALKNAVRLQPINEKFNDNPTLDDLWGGELTVNSKLYFFKEYFPDLFKLTTELFSRIFPTVVDTKIEFSKHLLMPVPVPVFLIKEKHVSNWIPLPELSSGMQKVLLIISDILSLPGDCLYIIDEYENSLGVNSIDFLPELLLEHGGDNQFLITTHHPHLINNMPIKNWLVFNRRGSSVRIKSGRDLEEKYGKSKQKAFIKLINDPFYSELS